MPTFACGTRRCAHCFNCFRSAQANACRCCRGGAADASLLTGAPLHGRALHPPGRRARPWPADYALALRGLEGEEREEAKRRCHQRGANRLLEVCFKNGGIYIKLGQHIGMLDHLLPSEYVLTMREHMLDRCPVSTYEQVGRGVEGCAHGAAPRAAGGRWMAGARRGPARIGRHVRLAAGRCRRVGLQRLASL